MRRVELLAASKAMPKFLRSCRVAHQTIVPTMITPRVSRIRSQFRTASGLVTWFGCTMAPMDMRKVSSIAIPMTSPAKMMSMACQVTDMGPSSHGLTGHIHVGDDETP